MLSLVATALIAASGAAALEKPSFKDIANGIDGVNDNTNGPVVIPGTNDGSSVFLGASIECSAEAWADRYRSSQNAYVYAVPWKYWAYQRMGGGFRSRDASWHTRRQAGTNSSANNSACAVKEAVKNTCYYGYDVTYWQKSYDFMIGWAHAFARAYASAEAECKAYSNAGSASGCAYAEADAYAISSAIASAHAEAVAEAYADYCSCTNAAAWSFGEADIVIKLIAEAFAEASAIACAKDHQVSKASAYVDCYAKAIAEVWAFALAKAAAEAQCWPGQDAKASADIIAKVGVHIQFQEKCVVDIYESGLADGSVGGSGTFTGAIDITPPHH